ncbi:hypothetical protein SAY86_015717 [Trapa natans]|uniref:non-specific serine/threonine protein kinase n=1 Tax=Trapa natans TaxID=22666 RepID=A0AAN7LIH5_TRANT|nr:hypothetical protein SAY86_015717 [Trapa natans]
MTRHRLPFPATAASVLLVFCSFVCHCNSQLLPADEVDALNTIATKLKNTHWPKLTRTSCSDNDGFNGFKVTDYIKSNVTCNCSYQSHSVCHVTNIQLRGMNMTGVIPQEFGRLAYLEELDLNRNYLNGMIPTNLTQIPLVILSLTGNRISGTIPKEIANMATLEELILEDNMLGGHLDPNLGKLSRLRRLLLSANNFTGEVPASFGNLKNLTYFLIDGSSLRGKIPEFIGNWTRLSRIDMQGSGIEGPIPSSISLLKTLTQLRISDLGGPSSPFPDLKNLTKLTYLVLRNCSLTGPIPPYIGDVLADTLYTLDLSFNKLTGPIPDSLQKLKKLNFLFLTDNMLSGEVPRWVLQNRHNMDLSYNDFTASSLSTCQQSNVVTLVIRTDWCVKKDLPCPGKPQYRSLFINCGGQKHTVGDKEYLDDLSTEGPSNFVAFNEQWAYSSTGYYLDNDKVRGYTVNNPFALNVTDSVLYQTARLSPISLKYYGLCMIPGRYKVRLHFAEIQFTNDETFSSNGRRCFDVSIQGEEVLTNFNIMEAAGGAGIGIYKDFDDVLVNNTTLEIHLYWSGKGTTAIPSRGVHGPLISAITVTPNFKVGGGLSTGAIVGIVLSSVLIVLTLIAVWLKGVLCRREIKDPELLSADLLTGRFTLRQIKAATGNFSVENKIGEGGFGSVYKGLLSDGTVIAVKQLSSRSKQGNREFLNEIGMISALHHPNLVKLYGCCTEGKQLLLVYEYLENNCLARALYGKRLHQVKEAH